MRRILASVLSPLVPKKVKSLWKELIDAHRPLPNPPDYVAPVIKNRPFWEVVKLTWRDYKETWVDSLGLRKEEPRPDLTKDLKDLKMSVNDVKDMAPTMKEILVNRLAAYRDAIQEFVRGYREGYADQNESGLLVEIRKSLENELGGSNASKTSPRLQTQDSHSSPSSPSSSSPATPDQKGSGASSS